MKLHRKITEWEWYRDVNVRIVFFHLIMIANYKDLRFEGCLIKRGQVVVGLKKLSDDTGLSLQQLRTVLKKLQSTNDITIESTNKYTLITLEKYELYQGCDHESNKQITNEQQTNNKQITNEQQTNNKQITTSKEGKKGKKERKEERKKGVCVSPHTPTRTPDISSIRRYCKEKGYVHFDYINFFLHYDAKNWIGIENWKAKLEQWVNTDLSEGKLVMEVKYPIRKSDFQYIAPEDLPF